MIDLTQDKKMISNEVVPRDPVYMAYGLGYTPGGELSTSILDNTNLYVVRDRTNKINKHTLSTRVGNLIKQFFLPENNMLGQKLSLSTLTSSILSLEGVKRIYTQNPETNDLFNGISFLSFNPTTIAAAIAFPIPIPEEVPH